MYALWQAQQIVFPPACWRCGGLLRRAGRAGVPPGHPYLCEACHAGLPRLESHGVQPVAGVDRVWAACSYEAPLKDWVTALKYGRRDALLRLLGQLLHDAYPADRVADTGKPIDAVVPVPLHPRRLWRRGFNQSLLLAHAWRRAVGRNGAALPPLATDVLVRHRYTRPQVRMSAAERHRNVADAFSLHHRLRGAAHPLEERRLLVVDDVATTGATLTACAHVLRAAGAARVEALVLARD